MLVSRMSSPATYSDGLPQQQWPACYHQWSLRHHQWSPHRHQWRSSAPGWSNAVEFRSITPPWCRAVSLVMIIGLLYDQIGLYIQSLSLAPHCMLAALLFVLVSIHSTVSYHLLGEQAARPSYVLVCRAPHGRRSFGLCPYTELAG